MNPVVGLDESKGESQIQTFLNNGKTYRKEFKIPHTIEGLNELFQFLEEIKEQPPVVMESIGHYQITVIQYLKGRDYLLIIVNPLISYRAKSSCLRKVIQVQMILSISAGCMILSLIRGLGFSS